MDNTKETESNGIVERQCLGAQDTTNDQKQEEIKMNDEKKADNAQNPEQTGLVLSGLGLVANIVGGKPVDTVIKVKDPETGDVQKRVVKERESLKVLGGLGIAGSAVYGLATQDWAGAALLGGPSVVARVGQQRINKGLRYLRAGVVKALDPGNGKEGSFTKTVGGEILAKIDAFTKGVKDKVAPNKGEVSMEDITSEATMKGAVVKLADGRTIDLETLGQMSIEAQKAALESFAEGMYNVEETQED